MDVLGPVPYPQPLFIPQKRAGQDPPFENSHTFAMFFSNAEDVCSRKRKKVVTAETEVPPPPLFLSGQHQEAPSRRPLVSTALRLDLNNGQPPPPPPVQLKPSPPFLSFTSLLTDDFAANIQEQSDQIDAIIQTHADQLRGALSDKWQKHYNTLICAAEEKASKRLKEGESELEKTMRRKAELEEKAARYRTESQFWQARTKKLEDMVEYMREATIRGEIMEAKSRLGCARCGGGEAPATEDAESSSNVDPERVDPTWMACKACKKRVAMVMMWPCRHVCVCRRCDLVTKACPVCGSLKTNSLEVFLPFP